MFDGDGFYLLFLRKMIERAAIRKNNNNNKKSFFSMIRRAYDSTTLLYMHTVWYVIVRTYGILFTYLSLASGFWRAELQSASLYHHSSSTPRQEIYARSVVQASGRFQNACRGLGR